MKSTPNIIVKIPNKVIDRVELPLITNSCRTNNGPIACPNRSKKVYVVSMFLGVYLVEVFVLIVIWVIIGAANKPLEIPIIMIVRYR